MKQFFLDIFKNLNQIIKHLLIIVNLINSFLFLIIFMLIKISDVKIFPTIYEKN